MKSKVSFEGIGEVIATFYAEGVEAGQVVKPAGEGGVAPCAAGERFCGVAVSARTGCAAVQVGGFVEIPCGDEAVTAGYVSLTADGKGGVKKAASGETGTEYWVAQAGDGFATLKL